MKRITSIIGTVLSLVIAICLSGCGDKREGYERIGRDNSMLGYDVVPISFVYDDVDACTVINSFGSNSKYYINVRTNKYDESTGENTLVSIIYSIDMSSGEVSSVTIPDGHTVCCLSDDLFYSVSDNIISTYDSSSGNLVGSYDYSGTPYIYDVIDVHDGYIVKGEGILFLYDSADNLVDSVENQIISFDSEIYEENGNLYYSCISEGIMTYYQIDFLSDSIQKVADANDLGVLSSFCQGEYIYNGYKIEKVDIVNEQLLLLADFNYIDICPPTDRLCTPSNTNIIDDNHFAVVNVYENNVIDIQLFSYNESIDTSYENTIEIGGYGCNEDLPLRWAVYLFNTSQAEYRAIVTDYANEGFEYWNGEQAAAAKAALIQYFNQGNAPDVFYGDSFDYNSFGRDYMVIDLMPYMNDISNELSDAARRLMVNPDGSCYQVFSAYQLDGYFADADTINSENLSISGIEEVAPINEMPLMRGMTYAQILDTIIRYEIPSRVVNGVDGFFTNDELVQAIEYSVSYGYPDYQTAGTLGTTDSPILNLAMLGDVQAYTSYYSGQIFVGYPSLETTNRVAKPFGMMAISASCSNPQKAWELISFLFDNQVQEACITGWMFPVVQTNIDEYRESLNRIYANVDEQEYEYLQNRSVITEESICGYFQAMQSVDTVQTNDWGVFNIITDEMISYSEGKSIDEIAESLQSRLELYINENYY
ncbi:MAG: hypothetical protein IKS48_11560 [Eubacterium sp.]|nr:hypothetical protein [Clostridiales bacterium]MBR6404011.1 hypothetical protein [Eubacterium sp.]